MQSDYLFVYGTLCEFSRSAAHEILRKQAKYIANAFIYGQLYEIDAYPGVIEAVNAKEKVHGELYLMIDAKTLLQKLDEYEECSPSFPQPHEYLRKETYVYSEEGMIMTAWCYFLNRHAAHYVWIQSGSYEEFCNDRKAITSK